MKQAIKKGVVPIKKKGLSAFKEKKGLSATVENISVSNADKPMEWLLMPKGFQEATHLPGFACGYVHMIGGFSDTGKSTVINHVIVAAQKQGYIPVIFDTENATDFSYLQAMGFECTPVYGDVDVETIDEESGEIVMSKENRIIGYDGNFLYYNNTILAEQYGQWDYSAGKESKTTKRKQAVIEDIAACIKDLLTAQENGEIDQGFVFIWDSIGSIGSYANYKSPVTNNMRDAGGLSQAFTDILNARIPASRKMSHPYTNTMVAISKIWLDSISNPIGIPSVKYKNGNTFYYACHGIIAHLGGALTSGTKKLKAVSKGATYQYGIVSKISVKKSHLPQPFNVTYEGELICTSHGIVSRNDLTAYQKEHVQDILKELNGMLADEGKVATVEDISFTEVEEENND